MLVRLEGNEEILRGPSGENSENMLWGHEDGRVHLADGPFYCQATHRRESYSLEWLTLPRLRNSDFAFLGGNAVAAWGYTNETSTDPGRPGVHLANAPAAGVDGTDGEHPVRTTVQNCSAREVRRRPLGHCL